MDRQANPQEDLERLVEQHEAGVADVLRAYAPTEAQYVAASAALDQPPTTYVASNTSPST
jgi:hypothetical protein